MKLIFVILVISGIVLYITLSKKIDMPGLGKITVWAFVGLLILLNVLKWGRIEALFMFIYSIINIAVAIYIYKKKKKVYKSIWLFGFFSYFSTVEFALRAHNINDDWWATRPAVVVAVIVLIPCLVYGIKEFRNYKDWEKLICTPLLGLMAGFGLTFLTLSSMNVYLDTSKPTYDEFVVLEKDIRTGTKRSTSYELKVQRGDTIFTIDVSEESYYDYEINDQVTLSLYNGAFNQPYYIHESSN